MAEQMLPKGIAGFNPQGDFIEGGGLPKRFRGLVKLARYIPRPLKKDGAKHGLFFFARLEDLETEIEHELFLRAGWLPRQFDDGRIAGTMPTNDGPDVDDNEREPTAPLEFFMGLGAGTKSIPDGTDVVDEYGGEYCMGDLMTQKEPFFPFCSALADCDFPFSSQSVASLEGWILTLESTKIGSYSKDGAEKDLKAHLPMEAEPPAKKKSGKTAAESVKKGKSKPAADEEEEETPKSAKGRAVATGKRKPEPEPEEEEEDDEEEESGGPVETLHEVIVGLLKKKPGREMPEGQVLIEAMKDAAFRQLATKERKAAVDAYNDRSLFEDSEVLILDEEADSVSLKKKGK